MPEQTTYRVPYSADQIDALTDSCLYGRPYGVDCDAYDYVCEELKKKSVLVTSTEISISLDDEQNMFIVTLNKE
jgi:hypothetical protein